MLPLLTYGPSGVQDAVRTGDAVSVCVKRAGARQMYWYPATVIAIDGDRALVELVNHIGERARLGARSIRLRQVADKSRKHGKNRGSPKR